MFTSVHLLSLPKSESLLCSLFCLGLQHETAFKFLLCQNMSKITLTSVMQTVKPDFLRSASLMSGKACVSVFVCGECVFVCICMMNDFVEG